jgi:hypothetical protein
MTRHFFAALHSVHQVNTYSLRYLPIAQETCCTSLQRGMSARYLLGHSILAGRFVCACGL